LEHDGGFYACHHFVDKNHLIGNIHEKPLVNLANDPAMKNFGIAKRDTLPNVCKQCEVLSFCNGGCPKDRLVKAVDEETGPNYLCTAFKAFFLHARPELTRLAMHIKGGKKLREFLPIAY